MKRRYGIAISAMILAVQFAGPVRADEPTVEQLEQIAVLLDGNDVRGMRAFLDRHPELMEGETELAQLLRQYMDESQDPLAFIGVPENRRSGGGDNDQDRLRAALPDAGAELDPSGVEPGAAAGPDPDVALY